MPKQPAAFLTMKAHSTWARLIAKLYEVHPVICPSLWFPEAVITAARQVRKDPGNLRLLQPKVVLHLIKTARLTGPDPYRTDT